MTLLILILLAFILFLSAFFSMSETALLSLSPEKAKAISLSNPSTAKELAGWINRPHELLTLILIGNTFVNVMFASLFTFWTYFIFSNTPDMWVEAGSWLVSTFVVVLFGEIIPKLIARSIPEKLSLFTLRWLSRMRFLAQPFINMVSSVLKMVSISIHKSSPLDEKKSLTLEELKILLEEGANNPTTKINESTSMMRRALELHHTHAETIMTPLSKIDVIEIDPKGKPIRNVELIIDLIVENGHTRTPIKKGGRIIGFIHTKDLFMLKANISDDDFSRLVRQPLDVKIDTPVSQLLELFRQAGTHIAFVYNHWGQIMGLVTLEDVLEEITGEILDEYDVAH